MKSLRKEARPKVENKQEITEREFERILSKQIGTLEGQLNHLQNMYNEIQDLKGDHVLKYYIINGVIAYEAIPKPSMGFKLRRRKRK